MRYPAFRNRSARPECRLVLSSALSMRSSCLSDVCQYLGAHRHTGSMAFLLINAQIRWPPLSSLGMAQTPMPFARIPGPGTSPGPDPSGSPFPG